MILRDLGVKEISVARGIKYYLGVIGCNHRTGRGEQEKANVPTSLKSKTVELEASRPRPGSVGDEFT